MKRVILLVACMTLELVITRIVSGQFPFEESLNIEIEQQTTCLGDLWIENGEFRALIGTTTGIAMIGEGGTIWECDTLRGVTAVARIDFELGDGQELIACSIGDSTGLVYHFMGEQYENLSIGSFGEIREEQWETYRNCTAKKIEIMPSNRGERDSKRIAILAEGGAWMGGQFWSESSFGVVHTFSVSSMTAERMWEAYQPGSKIEIESGEDAAHEFIYCGSESGRSGDPTGMEHSYRSFGYIQIRSDSVEITRLDGATGIGGLTSTLIEGEQVALLSLEDENGAFISFRPLPEFEESRSGRCEFYSFLGTTSNREGEQFILGLNGWHAEYGIYNLPELNLIHSGFLSESYLSQFMFDDFDGDGDKELAILNQNNLRIYSISNLGISTDYAISPPTLTLSSFPNPFNSSTTIRYSLPRPGRYALDVVDIQGRLVTRLADGWREAGSYREVWNADQMVSGTYLIRTGLSDVSKSIQIRIIK